MYIIERVILVFLVRLGGLIILIVQSAVFLILLVPVCRFFILCFARIRMVPLVG